MLSPTDVDLYALFGMDLDRTSPSGTNVSCLHLLGSFRFELRITSQVSAPNDERRAEDRKDVSTGNCSRSGNAFNPNSKVCDRKLIGALSLPLIRALTAAACQSEDCGLCFITSGHGLRRVILTSSAKDNSVPGKTHTATL